METTNLLRTFCCTNYSGEIQSVMATSLSNRPRVLVYNSSQRITSPAVKYGWGPKKLPRKGCKIMGSHWQPHIAPDSTVPNQTQSTTWSHQQFQFGTSRGLGHFSYMCSNRSYNHTANLITQTLQANGLDNYVDSTTIRNPWETSQNIWSKPTFQTPWTMETPQSPYPNHPLKNSRPTTLLNPTAPPRNLWPTSTQNLHPIPDQKPPWPTATSQSSWPTIQSALSTESRVGGNFTTMDNANISELLSQVVTEADAKTRTYSIDRIFDIIVKHQSYTRYLYYKNLAHEELWRVCVEKLTAVVFQIIEFAKMVPGFRRLTIDDQVILLQPGTLEIAVIRMSRYYDLSHNCVVIDGYQMGRETFSTSDPTEMRLVHLAFEIAKHIAELKLTDRELALYSALVLFSPDRPDLKGVEEVTKLGAEVLKSLTLELDKNRGGSLQEYVTACEALLTRVSSLKALSSLHMEALSKFKHLVPSLQVPNLHEELYPVQNAANQTVSSSNDN